MRVLVIEDDGATRAVLISTLRARRHDVVACADAEEAWAAIAPEHTAPFELAIVDVGLPGQDGVAFCQQFRRHATGRNAVLLLVTADERPGTLEAALDAGVHDYLLKPVDRRTLAIRLAIAEQRSLANATSRYSREALRESESRFEAFMRNSPAVAFIKDGHGRYLYVNRRYIDAHQINEGDHLGRTHFEVFRRELAEAYQRNDDIVLETGQPLETLEPAELPDGVHEWLTYKFPLNDNQGRPTLVAGLAVDVTPRLNAERALKAQAAQLRSEQLRLETVLRVAARLNAQGELQSVLDAVCEEVRTAVGDLPTTLSLVDPQSGDLVLRSWSGVAQEFLSVGARTPRAIWEGAVPLFNPLLDIANVSDLSPAEDKAKVESLGRRQGLAALVRREGRIVGALAIWTTEVRAFTSDERALLQGVADQAGLAITNSQLLDDVRRAESRSRRERDRAEALLRISRAVSERANLQDTLRALSDQTLKVLGSSRASVLLYYPDERVLRVEASSGGPQALQSNSAFAPVPLELHEQLAPLDVPVVVLDDIREFSASPNFEMMWNVGLRSVVHVRMVYGGELVGIVTAGEIGRFRQFSDEDQALLRGIADIAALAIRNQRLLDDVRRAESRSRRERDRAEALLRISRAVSESADLQTTLQAVCTQTRLALGSSRASVLLAYPQERVLKVLATAGGEPGVLPPAAFDPSPYWVHERMAPLSTPVVAFPDIREIDFSGNFQRMWDAGHRSIVLVRMIHDGELVGIVTAAEMGRAREYTEEEMALLRGISEIGALAIRNARLIEERRRTEEQMRNAQKLESLGVLAGGIAHDFNNLLVGVLGNAGLALLELPPDSPARQAVHDIETSAQRAADLTRQMLAYSGRGKFQVGPANLSTIVEEMTQLLGRVISKQARLELRLSRDLAAIVADATQVRQVVMNLITNASDALDGKPGLITLATSLVDASPELLAATYLNEQLPAGSYVCLEVTDSGVGMDEATRARIFEPFFTTKFTGRGLGLAAVLGIVRGHRGAIDVRSEPGSGTTFRVFFPAAPAKVVSDAAAAAPSKQWRGSGEILLVDDEEAVRAVAARVLERSGFEVIQAGSGEEALEICAQPGSRLRGVVLDLTMPGLGGEATYRQIRSAWPELPVIVSSGYMPQEGELGDVPFLPKPYRPSELLEMLRGILEPSAPSSAIV